MIKDAFSLFMSQKRFDLIFKWLYLKYPNDSFVKKAYLENIRSFNNYIEYGEANDIKKNGPDEFINSYDNLFASIKKAGFDSSKGLIPVGTNGEIWDGAHRLTISAFLGLDVSVQNVKENALFDYQFFRSQKMHPDIMDYGVLEYVKLNPNAYIVNLHSVSDEREDCNVEKILNKYGFIFFKKNINLTFNGYVNLKKLSYGSFWEGENSWIGSPENRFIGAQNHARLSMGQHPLRVFVFICDSLDKVIKAKSEIRSLFKLGNYSCHINDVREEAIRLAETYFNKNSLYLLNSRPFEYENTKLDNMIEDLKQTAKEYNAKIDNICCSGSSALDAFGIRECNDLDFLYEGENSFNIQTDTISNHSSELRYYPYSKKEIITNPHYHLYFRGVKFITLDVLYKMKRKRNEIPKDVDDCKSIEQFIQKGIVLGRTKKFKLFEKIKKEDSREIIIFGFIRIKYKKKRRV